MKNKIKTLIFIVLSLSIIGLLTTAVVAGSDLTTLNGSGYSNINRVFRLGYNNLIANKNTYCIQKNKRILGPEKRYTLTNYIEINGKTATTYRDQYGNATYSKNDYNAQVAYILNKEQGYGKGDIGTPAQNALWHVANSWLTGLGLNNLTWIKNDKVPAVDINNEAAVYANTIGDQQAGGESSPLNLVDTTNIDNVTIVDVGGYYRVGPFSWNFDGQISNIIVTSDVGDISDSDVRFVKYVQNTANIVDKTAIDNGEAFYVDISQNTNMNTFKGLKIQTKAESQTTVYKANIWVLQSSDYQNLIYVNVGHGNPATRIGEQTKEYNIPLKREIGLNKVDDRDETKPLANVGFVFKATVYRDSNWVTRYIGEDLKWSVADINNAKVFYTDTNGQIKATISGETIIPNSLKAVEVSNPYYGYSNNINKEYTVGNDVKFTNHQTRVKLSGYVWLDTASGKVTTRDDQYSQDIDNNGNGFNGIKVYLRDKNGNQIKETTTSELGLYSEINGGEYQFVDVDLDKLQSGEYYVEFEYCGITYQSVAAKLNQSNGSKAIDTTTRNVLDSKFTSVDGTGTQSLNINDVKVNYNNTSEYKSTMNSHTGCNVYARTNEAGYNLYSGFTPTSAEIRNVNLGLYEKAQTDYALTQDLYNVRVSVNGFSHIYRYGSVRYSNNGTTVNEDSSWNVGVKFQNNKGTYSRAIYKADAEYEAPNHRDNELKVYLTYKIALKNESSYLGRINNIVDYSDSNYEMIAAGTAIDDNDNISGNLNYGSKTVYNDSYSKYVIDVNTTLGAGETKYVYVQFQMNREAVLKIMNNGETLNNVAEINSYTTFKNNNSATPIAVLDKDSVPGNMKPGQVETYEDDTDAARSLKLEIQNARSLIGTAFVDESTVNENNERFGNGVFDNGESTIAGVKVKLNEVGKDDSSYDGERISMETTTDENGNFTFAGYIPGNYAITYVWGDKTYKVQYYKGTIYDESRDQNNKFWYKDNVDTRKTDALDSTETRRTIDAEMRKITKNNLDDEINKAYESSSDTIKTTTMDSTTPVMSLSVEYDTTITDGNDDKVEFIVKNVDFGIVQRPIQQIDIAKRVSKFKITLANGQILADAEVTEDGKLKGTHNYITYMAPTNVNQVNANGILRAEMDSELIEGAKVEITYAIKVTNVSEKDYDSERYYHYGNKEGAKLVKASVTGAIDYLDGRLSFVEDGIWQEKDLTYTAEVNASEKNSNEYLNSIRLYSTDKLQKMLEPGETSEVAIQASKLLASSDDNTFNNKSEIVDITKADGFNTGTPVKVTVSEDKFFFDTDNAEQVVIIPSTGENKNYTLPIVIGLVAIIILGTGVILIKKFVIDRK